jgi:ketosteroid isomerase-like protein
MKIIVRLTSLIAVLIATSSHSLASDVDDLTDLLQSFLAGSYTEEAHASFWADDLIYTSSAGLRFGKADIMASFDGADDSDAAPDTTYSATDIDIRVYGDTAIVAFKLVGTPVTTGDVATKEYYFNTGTFLRRNDTWKVVAWQATKIPPE